MLAGGQTILLRIPAKALRVTSKEASTNMYDYNQEPHKGCTWWERIKHELSNEYKI